MRAKFISEKFEETTDPLKDMGIGLLNFRGNFDKIKDFQDYMIKVLPGILETDEIPEDIIYDSEYHYINDKYFYKIGNHIKNRLKIVGENILDVSWANFLFKRLKEIGFKESPINERFDDESDPIQDMGIGLYREREFANEKEFAEWMVNYLPAILKTKNIPDDIVNPKGEGVFFPKQYRQIIRQYIDDYVTVKEGNLFKFSALRELLFDMGYPKTKMNEKFIEDSDPITDMRIGWKRIKFYPIMKKYAGQDEIAEWLIFRDSLTGKTIRGIFMKYKNDTLSSSTNKVTFKIRSSGSNIDEYYLRLADEDGEDYVVDVNYTYYIR